MARDNQSITAETTLQFDLVFHSLFTVALCICFYSVQARYYGLDTYKWNRLADYARTA